MSMKERKSYLLSAYVEKFLNGNGIAKMLVACGLTMFTLPAMAQNNPPSFVGGATQALSVCENTSAVSIDPLMSINDLDAFQTETWTVSLLPSHGMLSGLPFSDTSTGFTLTPSGLSYTPFTGYSGNDTFIVEVSDGLAVARTTVVATVVPLARLTTPLVDSFCNETPFVYIPASDDTTATFSWNRPFTGGISNLVASGTDTISETLVNTSYYDISVPYNFVITAGGCTNMETVMVTVHPTPRLSSPLFDTLCSGSVYSYMPATPTAGTTYTWTRSSVSGVVPATAMGTGNINETLVNGNPNATSVVYSFLLTANGCTATRNLELFVSKNYPVLAKVTTKTTSSVCAGSLYVNYGASAPQASGVTYRWSAVNASVYAVSANRQYSLVNFPDHGNASVIFTYDINGTRCVVRDTIPVTVGSTIYQRAEVIYSNGQFAYLDNTANSFQWGYDDVSTLDSTVIPGATLQSYPITNPDFTHKYYWVMATKYGCTQKVYHKIPLAVSNVNVGNNASLKVYPNPAVSMVSVDLNMPAGVVTDVMLTDMLGQTIKTESVTGQNVQFDIADLPSGCYLISGIQNGVKLATVRFIKN